MSRRPRLFNCTWICLFILAFTIISCMPDPDEIEWTNPLDPLNSDTGGNPYQLTAQLESETIHLEWQSVNRSDITGYNIYRAVNDGDFTMLANVSSDTEFRDTAIELGKTYRYFVVVRTTRGEGTRSAVVETVVHSEPRVILAGGAETTAVRSVPVQLSAFAANRMQIANGEDPTASAWEDYQANFNWLLEPGEGTRHVSLRVAYTNGDTSDVVRVSIDPSPLEGSVHILTDAPIVSNPNVTLQLASETGLEYALSNSSDNSSVEWRTIADQVSWSLPSNTGIQKVYLWVRHEFYAVGPYSDSLGIDLSATISTFSWDTDVDTLTPDDFVTFTLTASDFFGPDSAGTATVQIENMTETIALNETEPGEYTGIFYPHPDLPLLIQSEITASFTDRFGNQATIYQSEDSLSLRGFNPGERRSFMLEGAELSTEMAWIPPGSYLMGEMEFESDEQPRHQVDILHGFWMATAEMTQEEYIAIMGTNPSHTTDATHPVENVSFDDAVLVLDQLNSTSENPKWRLPSEAEWEYACRATTETAYYWGEDSEHTLIPQYAATGVTPGVASTVAVRSYLPNVWNLYDMSGNVSEWCEDSYHSTYSGAPADGSPWIDSSISEHVSRGGSWVNSAAWCRSGKRNRYESTSRLPTAGLRLVRNPGE